jgi:GntR family transcriptional repressor for pyruvate dehydrogenase complex
MNNPYHRNSILFRFKNGLDQQVAGHKRECHMFSTVRGNKISQQIIAQIRGMIFEGKLSTGDKLPPENILTEQFGVSRQTLREALRALEFIGLIEIKKGTAGGPCIAEMDSSIAQEMLANYLYFKNISVKQVSRSEELSNPRRRRSPRERLRTRN